MHPDDIRKLYKHNQSYALTLPKYLVRELKWQERQKLVVTKQGKKLIIEDWEK